MVERLTQAGFAVAFTWLSSQGEAEALSKTTGALAIQADLTDPPLACQRVFGGFCGKFSELDLLVNNASIYLPSEDLVLARKMMAMHFECPLLLCRQFESHLRRARGHIINMVDLMVERPLPKYVAYCASKAALWNLTLALARDLAPDVTVNGIAPGVLEWPDNYPQDDREKYLKRVPLGRAGTPAEAAEAVLFLATGGSYMTGQIIRLDGGRSIT